MEFLPSILKVDMFIVFNIFLHRAETNIGDEQFAFMPGRGTKDKIFAVRQLMEKHREKQTGLHMVFIDLEKECLVKKSGDA